MSIILVSALLLGLATTAAAQPSTEPVVVVRGAAVVKAAPDTAWVTLGGEHRARDAKQAQADNAAAMNAVHARVLALGVPKDALRTTGYDLQLEFDYRDGRQVPRGYVARSRLDVRLDDVTRVGELLEAAVAAGATTVHDLRFDVAARARLEREALGLAVADARARAEAMATGAGRALGVIVRIEEAGVPGPMPSPMLMARAVAEQGLEPPVAPGEIEIRAEVTLTATLR